jgi:diaminopimelate decarboxylase
VVDPESAVERLKTFQEFLPMAEVFYAVKTNNDDRILKALMN